MTQKTLQITDALHAYMLENWLREHPAQAKLREATAALPQARMQIAPEQGQFMAVLTRLLGARRTLDVGVFTGYSALSVALALPAGGEVIALDINTEWTAIAREHWRAAGVADKIDLRLAPALQSRFDRSRRSRFLRSRLHRRRQAELC